MMWRGLRFAYGVSKLVAHTQIAVVVFIAIAVVQARAADTPNNFKTVQNVDHQKFDKSLQDVRDNIDKTPGIETSTPNRKAPVQQPIDVCKVNPRLPQCKY
jgi:hypothetical protein